MFFLTFYVYMSFLYSWVIGGPQGTSLEGVYTIVSFPVQCIVINNTIVNVFLLYTHV